jgi:integrase
MSGTVRKAADGSWIADVSVNGTRRTARCKSKAEALARKKQLLERLVTREARPVSTFTLADARALSLRVRWGGTAYERTAAIYSAQAVEHFGRGCSLDAITTPAVDAWRQLLLQGGNRPSTVNRKVSALRAMLADAQLHGHLQDVPKMPQQLRAGGHRDRVISDQERDMLCNAFRQMGEPAAADLLVFLLETAARWGEAERLRCEHVDLVKGRVTFWATKNGKPRSVPLTRRATDALLPHHTALGGARLWPYSYRRFQWLWDAAKGATGLAGDSALTIHTTRHTCASKLASRGIPLHQLMAFGGWTSLASVQRYLHLHTDALAGCVAALEL